MNVDNVLGKTEIYIGNTLKYAKFGHFMLPYGHF